MFGNPEYKLRLPNNMYYIMDELVTENPMDEGLVDKLTNYGCWCQLQTQRDAPRGKIFSFKGTYLTRAHMIAPNVTPCVGFESFSL